VPEKRKLNLVVHCGGYRVDRGEVERVATPEGTRSWVPIPHRELLELVERTLRFQQYEVVDQQHALARDGARYFGLMHVQPKKKKDRSEDSGTVVGVRNSNDKSFPAGLCLGDAPFVCDNLVFSGDVTLTRKHTTNVRRDLPNLVDRAMGQLMDLRFDQTRRITRYRDAPLGDAEAHDLLIQALDARVIPNAKVPKVLEQWRRPAHEEFEERVLWSFYNAFTEVMKGTNLFTKPRTSQALHGVLDPFAGLPRREVA